MPRRCCSSRSGSRSTRSTSAWSDSGRPQACSAAARSDCCSSSSCERPAPRWRRPTHSPTGLPRPSSSARARASGNGLDVAFEVAGDDEALAAAADAVRPGGRIVLVGIPDGDRTSFTASTVRRKELTIALCRRMTPADLPRAIRLAETGRIELAPLVTGRYPLADWEHAFDHLVERRGLKAVVEP